MNIDVSQIISAADQVEDARIQLEERDLTKPEFVKLLALNGWEDVWDGLEAALKAQDISLYAEIRSQREQANFRLDATLAFVAQVKPIVQQIAPEIDLSEAAIRAAWMAVATPPTKEQR